MNVDMSALTLTDALAVIASAIALVVSGLSWLAAVNSNRASIFDRRFEVFSDTEKFLAAWIRAGSPDLGILHVLVQAWNRSHFLFPFDVTRFLRRLWLDAIDANQYQQIIAGTMEGDREDSLKKQFSLKEKYFADEELLRRVFTRHLSVRDSWLP